MFLMKTDLLSFYQFDQKVMVKKMIKINQSAAQPERTPLSSQESCKISNFLTDPAR